MSHTSESEPHGLPASVVTPDPRSLFDARAPGKVVWRWRIVSRVLNTCIGPALCANSDGRFETLTV